MVSGGESNPKGHAAIGFETDAYATTKGTDDANIVTIEEDVTDDQFLIVVTKIQPESGDTAKDLRIGRLNIPDPETTPMREIFLVLMAGLDDDDHLSVPPNPTFYDAWLVLSCEHASGSYNIDPLFDKNGNEYIEPDTETTYSTYSGDFTNESKSCLTLKSHRKSKDINSMIIPAVKLQAVDDGTQSYWAITGSYGVLHRCGYDI